MHCESSSIRKSSVGVINLVSKCVFVLLLPLFLYSTFHVSVDKTHSLKKPIIVGVELKLLKFVDQS